MTISKFGTTINKSSTPNIVRGIENKVSKSGDIMYGNLNLNGHSIKNLASPEEESDSVNKGFLESNFVRFEDNVQINSKLAIIDENRIASSTPIQVQGRDLIGVSTIRPVPQRNSVSDNNSNIYIALGDSLYLRGVSQPALPSDGVNKQYVDERFNNVFSGNIDLHGTHKIVNLSVPTDPTDAASKQYVDDHFHCDLNLNNNQIIGLANPIDDYDAATKIFVPQPAYDVYRVFCNSVNREIQLTRLGGKNNLCTLHNNNAIGVTDVSPNNLLRISISGSAVNNTAGNLTVKLVESPRERERTSPKILERFHIRRSPVERPQQRTFHATILVQPISTSNEFVCEYSTAPGSEAYFEFGVIFMFELIKIA